MHLDESKLVFDWNRVGSEDSGPPRGRIELNDETLRDGLQSPSVRSPTTEQKLDLLHRMAKLGIDAVDIGLPGAGPHVVESVLELAREIVDQDLPIQPNCAARTVIRDIEPIVEISQRVGTPIAVAAFIGSPPRCWPSARMATAGRGHCPPGDVAFLVNALDALGQPEQVG